MRYIFQLVKNKGRRHSFFLIIIAVTLTCGVVINYLNSKYTENKVVISFQKNFEKQASAELNAYSFGLQSLFETRLTLTLTSLEKLTNETSVRASILSKSYGAATTRFRELIDYDERFNTVYIVDQNGIIQVAINKENDNSVVGNDMSALEHIKTVMDTKESYIGNARFTARGNNIIPFSVPVLDDHNTVVAVVTSGSFISNIAESIATPNELPGLYFSVLDAMGNLIMTKGEAPEEITNVKGKDPLISALVEDGEGSVRSEFNYLGDEVFAKGASVEVGGNKFFVASYYLQSKYNHDLSVIQTDFKRSQTTSRIRSLAMYIFGAVIVFWIIKNHEKVTKE